jgi:hypothetical protein
VTDSRFQELADAMSVSLTADDLQSHYDAECALESLHLDLATQAFATGHLDEAAAEFEVVARLNQELVDTLQRAIDNGHGGGIQLDQLQEWRSAAHSLGLLSSGQAALGRGLISPLPSDALARFAEAEEAFRQVAETGEDLVSPVLAEYALGLRETSEAREEQMRLDYDGATQAFMRARTHLEAAAAVASAPDAGEEFVDLAPRLVADAQAVAAQYERSAFSARFLAGDYQEACEHANESSGRLEAALAALADQAPAWLVFVLRSQLAQVESERLRAEGAQHRQQSEWEQAQHAYEGARRALMDAAKLTLQTGLPQATATQEALVSAASLTIGGELRSLRSERTMGEEIARLRHERDELVQNMRSGGVTVNSYAEARAAAEQNTQIAVRVEQSVRASLGDLEQALRSSELGPEREEVLGELQELMASSDQPSSFLERAGRLTGRVARIAKSVGEAAAPLLPVLRVLGPLVGVPIV